MYIFPLICLFLRTLNMIAGLAEILWYPLCSHRLYYWFPWKYPNDFRWVFCFVWMVSKAAYCLAHMAVLFTFYSVEFFHPKRPNPAKWDEDLCYQRSLYNALKLKILRMILPDHVHCHNAIHCKLHVINGYCIRMIHLKLNCLQDFQPFEQCAYSSRNCCWNEPITNIEGIAALISVSVNAAYSHRFNFLNQWSKHDWKRVCVVWKLKKPKLKGYCNFRAGQFAMKSESKVHNDAKGHEVSAPNRQFDR